MMVLSGGHWNWKIEIIFCSKEWILLLYIKNQNCAAPIQLQLKWEWSNNPLASHLVTSKIVTAQTISLKYGAGFFRLEPIITIGPAASQILPTS